MQNRQIFRRCMRRGPRPGMPARSYSRSKPYALSRSSKFVDITLSFQIVRITLCGFCLGVSFRLRDLRLAWLCPPLSLSRAAIFQLLGATPIFIDAYSHVSQNAIVDAHATLELGDFRAGAIDFQQHVNAIALVTELVSELALAHHLSLCDAAALIGDDLLGRFRQAHNFGIVRVRIDDENYFVSSFFCHFVLRNS